ncbi:TSUP family transporter [Alteromonas sp. CYL-A6]|uniref:TSUP family transporter n=1 Tax=Alteromonas nitratireducens TaxID=3390813 RepID=UPI0034AE42D8
MALLHYTAAFTVTAGPTVTNDTLLILGFLICGATLIQSLTGFGFGLFVIASVTLFTPVPVSTTAFIISALSLVNAADMAIRHRHAIQWRSAATMLTTGLPALVMGFVLLEWLSAQYRSTLMMLLGLCILGCSLLLMLRRRGLKRQSPPWQFAVAGTLGGLLGGLFSTFGPPVVFQCYRQPWDIEQVKATLLSIFSLAALCRLVLVPFGTTPNATVLWFTLAAIPVVMVSTRIARYLAPRIPAQAIRVVAVFLLAVSGVSLLLKALTL